MKATAAQLREAFDLVQVSNTEFGVFGVFGGHSYGRRRGRNEARSVWARASASRRGFRCGSTVKGAGRLGSASWSRARTGVATRRGTGRVGAAADAAESGRDSCAAV